MTWTLGTLIFLFLLVVVIAALHWLRPAVLGFEGKTLWDWLSLLLVPSLIASATLVVGEVQTGLEANRQEETGTQQYFDRMSNLVLDHPQSDAQRVIVVGRAHTRAILQLVSGERAGRILVFLDQLEMLQPIAPELDGLDLTGAMLKGLALDGLDFEQSNLVRVDFEDASLRNVDFEAADLRDADLKFTVLRGAELNNARLDGAILRGADLRGTDLSQASGLDRAQLAGACMDAGTQLPPDLAGALVDNPDCEGVDEDDDDDDADDDEAGD